MGHVLDPEAEVAGVKVKRTFTVARKVEAVRGLSYMCLDCLWMLGVCLY